MAEKIVSPGVFTRENDLSFVAQGVGEIGAAIIGPFHKGPAFVPTVVNTQSEFEEIIKREPDVSTTKKTQELLFDYGFTLDSHIQTYFAFDTLTQAQEIFRAILYSSTTQTK